MRIIKCTENNLREIEVGETVELESYNVNSLTKWTYDTLKKEGKKYSRKEVDEVMTIKRLK